MCVCVCVFRQHFFVGAYYRYSLSTYFCSDPFKSPYSYFDIRLELVKNFLYLTSSQVFLCPYRDIIKGEYIAKVQKTVSFIQV